MKSRWIGMIVCLLYLSAATIFSAVHHHDDPALGNDQCAACAWHHDAQVDVPIVIDDVPLAPVVLTCGEQTFDSVLRELSLKIHPSRGPPLLPL